MSQKNQGRGIRTIFDLRDRCRVQETARGGHKCWEWAGGRNSLGQGVVWLPALKRRVALGTLACVLLTGKEPEKGVFWYCVCDTRDCANPFHRKPGSRSEHMKAAGYRPTAGVKAKIAATKRAKSSLSEAACADIRSSVEPLSVVAKRHGICINHAWKIRRGMVRVATVPGASVFSLGST